MSDTDNSLFDLFNIGTSIHHLNKKTEKSLGLSLVQWGVLSRLVDMPATSAYLLSKSVGVHPSTLTQTLKRLEKKKFIFVAEDPRDSRKKVIAITRLGKDALENTTNKIKALSRELSQLKLELSRVQTCLKNHADVKGDAVTRH